ncbi:TPA: hypothetical protein G8N93_005397 [Salmonella enterica]|nr:hypothetical protein [Salmonella enterica]
MNITVDCRRTNQKIDTGKTLKPWPVLVDHYSCIFTWVSQQLSYLHLFSPEALRYDLHGQSAGSVSDDQIRNTRLSIERILRARARSDRAVDAEFILPSEGTQNKLTGQHIALISRKMTNIRA